jgi:hypothetical protein
MASRDDLEKQERRRAEIELLLRTRQADIEDVVERYVQWSNIIGPCDREAAQARVESVYRKCGLKEPAFVWFDSPLSATVSVALWAVFDAIMRLAPPGSGAASELSSENIASIISDSSAFARHPILLSCLPPASQPGWRDDELDSSRLLWEIFDTAGFARYHEPLEREVWRWTTSKLDPAQPLDWWLKPWENTGALLPQSIVAAADWSHCSNSLLSRPEGEQREVLRVALRRACSGNFEIGNYFWCPLNADFLASIEVRNLLGLQMGSAFIELQETMSLCGQWWPTDRICFMVDRPIAVHVDHQMNAHRLNEPAISFADGWGVYCLRNLPVSESVAQGHFTWQDIDSERNSEMRRVMTEVYGLERYVNDCGIQPVASDQFGVLYRKPSPPDEDMVIVKVFNATLEPDGTRRSYFLRVPPEIGSAREAVAWTFGLSAEEYEPDIES